MNSEFQVRHTDAAREDLIQLFDFLLLRAKTREDFDAAQRTIDTLAIALESHLSRTPFIFRKASGSPFLRELVIPCGEIGYVAPYEIEGAETVNILALR